jgi:demethylmenaquinone methyltransferase/2-methoxy-6-polyprenyl-1,4-benzoquinol methylase
VKFLKQRIDIPFDLNEKFDKIFISFVIHGFPHEIRKVIIENTFQHLKPGGEFQILDFAEFDMDKMPVLHRKIFTAVECKYAFDYIKRDWKEILRGYGFDNFEERSYMKQYVRLLRAVKVL